MLTRRCWLLGVGAFAIGVASCAPSETRVPTFPVSGTIMDGKKPLVNATVVFHPVSGLGGDAVRPRGRTDEQGQFTLTTYDGNDGAPVGEYTITVEQYLAGRPDEGPRNRLPAKYAKHETSGLRATIQAAPNELTPFALKK